MKFRKKPVVIEAVQWDGSDDSASEVLAFNPALECGPSYIRPGSGDVFFIPTLEGLMEAAVGDWIICGVKGEFYPCKPDIFEASYEPA